LLFSFQPTGPLRNTGQNWPLEMGAIARFYAEKAEKRELFAVFLV
jgi:hypothetical protein